MFIRYIFKHFVLFCFYSFVLYICICVSFRGRLPAFILKFAKVIERGLPVYSSYFETPRRISACCLYVVLWFVSPTVLQTSNPTMSALLPAACALLLGLLGASFSPASCCRFQIPPHDQVARVARFVAHQCDWASMATISTHKPVAGQPFSNAFSVSDGTESSGSGVPYMYLTRMEISVQDLEVTCTLLLQSALLLECLNYDKLPVNFVLVPDCVTSLLELESVVFRTA